MITNLYILVLKITAIKPAIGDCLLTLRRHRMNFHEPENKICCRWFSILGHWKKLLRLYQPVPHLQRNKLNFLLEINL